MPTDWERWHWREEQDRRRREREEKNKLPEEIDEIMRWIYIHFRVDFSELEQLIEARGDELSDVESKRLDKAMVVMKTGFKMMKKVIRQRAPAADTAAWRQPGIASGPL